jgi:integrase/recombinase XerD
MLSSVKSLLAFGRRVGYLRFDVGAAIRLPSRPSKLAERILSETDITRLLLAAGSDRNRLLLRTLYLTGLRVSELSQLRWRDISVRGKTAQITVFGKGGKSRSLLLPPALYQDLGRSSNTPDPDAYLFPGTSGPLSTSQVRRICRSAAHRGELGRNVSPHWLRHSHASHALDRGAPIHVVQASLGHASMATTGRYTHARPDSSSGLYLAAS